MLHLANWLLQMLRDPQAAQRGDWKELLRVKDWHTIMPRLPERWWVHSYNS